MEPKTIRSIIKSAQKLEKEGDLLSAFALFWIAFEGLVFRIAIKALWMRGVSVRNSQIFFRVHRTENLSDLVTRCCGVHQGKNISFIQSILKLRVLRDQLFHTGSAPDIRSLKPALDLLSLALNKPSNIFSNLTVKTPEGQIPIGNPLEDLRGKKRRFHVAAKPATEMIEGQGEFLFRIEQRKSAPLTRQQIHSLLNSYRG